MIAIDNSALVAILRREPEAASLPGSHRRGGRLPAFIRQLARNQHGACRARGRCVGRADLDALVARAGVQVVAQGAALTEVARQAFRRYGKGRHPAGLNLGDCASYALARTRGVPLPFKGNDFPHDLTPAA